MKNTPDSETGADLRKRAEDALRRRAIDLGDLSSEDTQSLIHELQVHQIELEMQNEELRTAQLELAAARDRYSDLYEFAPVGYFSLSDKGLILETNLTGAALLGVERGNLVNRPLSRFVLPADQEAFYLHFKKLSETLKPLTWDLRLVKDDKSQFSAQLASVPIVDDGGNFSQCRLTVSDITARMRAEEALKRLNDELERRVAERTTELEVANEHLQTLIRVKDEFISTVSHEMLTPISSLKTYHYLIEIDPDKLDRYLDVLKRETNRLHYIIEDMLRLSRLDQGQIEMKLALVALNPLVRLYVADRVPLAEGKGLSLTFDEQSDLPPVQADEGLLGQVVSGLLTNAMNYTPDGGQIAVSTDLRHLDDKEWITFSVSDTGPGIPLEEQPRLFERFFRGRVSLDTHTPGTGLGLSIAKKIVERHRGRIEFESQGIPGKGATFTVWLPVEAKTPG
jgi:PAS domain S-box-containing protein